jgi:hypothetical protein
MANGQDPCDAACQKIIIDGDIMIDRANYLISVLLRQKDRASALIKMATPAERKELLVSSQKQCDFSKLIEASANETAYLMSEIASAHAGLPDADKKP